MVPQQIQPCSNWSGDTYDKTVANDCGIVRRGRSLSARLCVPRHGLAIGTHHSRSPNV